MGKKKEEADWTWLVIGLVVVVVVGGGYFLVSYIVDSKSEEAGTKASEGFLSGLVDFILPGSDGAGLLANVKGLFSKDGN